MKKILISVILLSLILSVTLVTAQTAFDVLKQTIIRGIDRTISRINTLENRIQNNPDIEDGVKNSAINLLNVIETDLNSYKSRIEDATTLAELREINQEIKQYLRDNKDVLKEKLRNSIVNIGQKVLEKTEKFKQYITSMIRILEIICPNQVSELKQSLEDLNDQMEILRTAIQTKDTVAIKNQIEIIKDSTKEIKTNAIQIWGECCSSDRANWCVELIKKYPFPE